MRKLRQQGLPFIGLLLLLCWSIGGVMAQETIDLTQTPSFHPYNCTFDKETNSVAINAVLHGRILGLHNGRKGLDSIHREGIEMCPPCPKFNWSIFYSNVH